MPFIVLSGLPNAEGDSLVMGACGFLGKNDLAPERLVATIEKVV